MKCLKYLLVPSVLILVAINSTLLFAEKMPEDKDEADCVVTAAVEAIYSRTVRIDKNTPFEIKRIEYVIELNVQQVHRGGEGLVGNRLYVHCFKRDVSSFKPGTTPLPGMSGHSKIPEEGQTIKAYIRQVKGKNNGLYPDWFELVEEDNNKEK